MTIQAFSSHSPFVRAGRPGQQRLCAQRRLRGPRRRPRGNAVIRAVFIWSGDAFFGDEETSDNEADNEAEHLDNDNLDDGAEGKSGNGDEESDTNYDHPVFGNAWRRKLKSNEEGDHPAGEKKEGPVPTPLKLETSASGHPNTLYDALRERTSGPEDVDKLADSTTDNAADAFRRVVMGIFGTLPADSFDIAISTDRNGVARIMQSSMATGYALRNAEFRMMLNKSIGSPLAGSSNPLKGHGGHAVDTAESDATGHTGMPDLFASEPDYMKNVPKRGKVDVAKVTGQVNWWNMERDSKEEMAASDYIAKLEAENELLRERLDATIIHDGNNNGLLEYMRTLSPEKISALQGSLGADAMDAFKRTIKSVLGELSSSKVQITVSTSRDYLAQLAFWCLLVGYHVRNLEKRIEMAKMLEVAESMANFTHNDKENPSQ